VFALRRRELHALDGFHNIIAQHRNISLGAAHSGDRPQAEVVLPIANNRTAPVKSPGEPRTYTGGNRRQCVAGLILGLVDTLSRGRAKKSGERLTATAPTQRLQRPTEEEQLLTTVDFFVCSFRHPVLDATAGMFAADH